MHKKSILRHKPSQTSILLRTSRSVTTHNLLLKCLFSTVNFTAVGKEHLTDKLL